TIGDLINTIQTVLNHDTLDTVVIDAGGRLHTAPDYWTATYGRPAEEVIDVGAHQEATQILQKLEISVSEPVTAKKLAAEAIERGWVDNAIDELATKQAYSLRIPHPHEGY